MYDKQAGDKGYISKYLIPRLFVDGIQLVGKLKSNMKGSLMSVYDKMLLRKRAIIKTNNDGLKTSHK
jgi:transposase, IS4 family (fragment)